MDIENEIVNVNSLIEGKILILSIYVYFNPIYDLIPIIG